MKRIISMLVVLLLLPIQAISANEGAGFSVSRFVSPHQIDQSLGYHYLKLAPNQTTQLTIQINNDDDQAGEFTIKTSTMYTSHAMQLSYGQMADGERTSVPAKHQMSQILAVENPTITVAGNTSQRVTLDLQMPDEAFVGEIAGGITVTRAVRDSEKQATGITNQFAYVLPVILVNQKTTIQPKLTLGDVAYTSDDNGNAVRGSMSLTSPERLLRVSGTATIKDAEKQVVYEYDITDRQMAPQSVFDLVIPLNETALRPGNYTLDVNLANGKNDKWQWTKAFEVTQEAAEKSKDNILEENKPFTINLWLVAIAVLLAIVAMLLWLIMRLLKARQ